MMESDWNFQGAANFNKCSQMQMVKNSFGFMLQIVTKLKLLDLTVIHWHCPSESNEGYQWQFGAMLVNLGHFLAFEANMNQYKYECLFQNPILQISQSLQINQKWVCIPN